MADEIGLFPLGIVVLPGELTPLHIFEPRYRELVGEAIELETPFGILLTDDEGLREVGTTVRVTEVVERFEDGRFVVVVEGGERFRLLRFTEGRAFRTGEVEPVADGDAEAPFFSSPRLMIIRSLNKWITCASNRGTFPFANGSDRSKHDT